MRYSDGRIPIGSPANPDDIIPGTPDNARPDRSGPEGRPLDARAVENTRYSHPDKTLYIQMGGMSVTAEFVNTLLARAKLKGWEVESVVLFISQETKMEQGPWLEKQGYEQQIQTNFRSLQFVMRQHPAKRLED